MSESPAPDVERQILEHDWFYEFTLPSGRRPPCRVHPHVRPLHTTRAELVMEILEPRYGDRWPTVECADLACHQGYFSLMLAERGCRHVLGVDARQDHLDRARLIRDAFGLANWSFARHDLQEIEPTRLGSFDVVLVLGLLYHLENPMKVLRLVSEVTRDVCVIETQIVPNLTGPVDWGSYRHPKHVVGCFGLVDEEAEVYQGNCEANTSSVSLVPSREGLVWLLEKVGFRRVEVVTPRQEHHEQLRSGKRIVVAAFKE